MITGCFLDSREGLRCFTLAVEPASPETDIEVLRFLILSGDGALVDSEFRDPRLLADFVCGEDTLLRDATDDLLRDAEPEAVTPELSVETSPRLGGMEIS